MKKSLIAGLFVLGVSNFAYADDEAWASFPVSISQTACCGSPGCEPSSWFNVVNYTGDDTIQILLQSSNIAGPNNTAVYNGGLQYPNQYARLPYCSKLNKQYIRIIRHDGHPPEVYDLSTWQPFNGMYDYPLRPQG